MSEIGKFVKLKREERNWKQADLCRACGVSDRCISDLESGQTAEPKWNNLCKIAKALSFSPLEFLLEAGYITENDIHPHLLLYGLDELSNNDLVDVQKFVDFLIYKKRNEDKNGI